MKKNLLLYILLIILLLANGFFLFQHFGDKKENRNKGKRGQGNFIARQLNFNETQLNQFNDIRSFHRKTMRSYDDDIKDLKGKFFSNISNENTPKSLIDSIATLISEKEKLKDIETYNYFTEVRNICEDHQKEQLSFIIKKAIHNEGYRRPNGPPRRGDGPLRGEKRPPRH